MLVIPAEPGDPISAVFVDDSYIVCGTLMGRVWLYKVAPNTRQLLSGYSDEAIRGIYIQDNTVYATVGDQFVRHFRLNDPYDQLDVKFSRRSSSSGFKYVLQKFNQVTVFYPGMTVFLDVVSNAQSMCPFKLQQPLVINVCPVDAYQYLLLFTEFAACDTNTPPPRKFKLVDVSSGSLRWETVNPLISLAKFISDSVLVYCVRNTFCVFDIVNLKELRQFKNIFKSDVIAVDASLCMGHVPRSIIVAAGADGSVVAFDYTNGSVLARERLKNFSFSLGFPYHIQACWDTSSPVMTVTVTSDYGAHFLRLTVPPSHVETRSDVV